MSQSIASNGITQPDTPALHLDNITGSPGTTFAGLGLWASAAMQALGTGGLPTSTAGWFVFGSQAIMGLLSIFGRG